MSFPTLDLARFESASPAERYARGVEIDAICRTTGFLTLTGHGVAQPVIDDLWSAAEAFFASPAQEKLKAKAPVAGYPYGYLPPLAEALARSKGVETPPDLKESFNGGPEAAPPGLVDAQALAFCYAPTIWPDPPGFQAAWRAYYRAMEDLAARVMRAFAVALELPDDFFAPFIDAPISALRALNYPALDRAPAPGQIRAGAHTDYGSLTILAPQEGSRGLEIFSAGALDRGSSRRGRLRRQHRRSDGALDRRPLGVDAASRRRSGGRRQKGAALIRLLPPAELGR